jgi:hypothetical protein
MYGEIQERLIQILLKDQRAYEALVEKLTAAYTRAWSVGHQEAVGRCMRRLEEIGPARFSREAEAEILAAFEAEVGPQAMARLLDGPVTVLGEAIWRVGGREGAGSAGVDYRFDLVDQEALALARRGDLFWVSSHWDRFTRAQLSEAVAEYFAQGQTYEQLAAALREAMVGVHEAGMRYWELAADTMATKTREMGRISGYQQAGVRYVQVQARLDERTTPLCRSLHGRLIRLETVVAQRDRYLEAAARGRLDMAREVWPLGDAQVAIHGALPENVGLPPYHYRCRTITVAWLGEDPQDVQDPLERARLATLQREPARREDVEKLIELAMQAKWDAGNLKRHMKHAHSGITDYNQAALDLIRRGGREVALAMAQGQLLALFFTPYKGDRVRVAVVNLDRARIVTLHIRRGIENERVYDVQPIPQPKARGIMRWWR